MWTFEEPLYLVLLLILPVLIYLKHFWPARGGRLDFPLSLWQGVRFSPLQPGVRTLMGISSVAFWISFALALFALAGPGLTFKEKIYLSPGTDIMIVLDTSPSMGAKDFPPDNRFEAARKVITNFIKGRENDPIGLVAFGKQAVLRVPPTVDYEFLLDAIGRLGIMELGDGTALGMGIALAALHLRHSPSREKVIMLFTDGVNNAGEIQPETASEVARSLGISLYVIGIGTAGVVPTEFTDPETGKTFSGSMEGGFNEDLLKKLTGGKDGYYFSTSSAGHLESVVLSIDSRESTAKRMKIQVENLPLFQHFLFAAFLGFTAYFLIRKVALGEIL